MIFIAAICYALLFWAIGSRYPKVPLFLIFAAGPFQNDISGGGPVKFSIAEINMLLTVPLFFLRARRFTLGPITLPVMFYLGVGLLSSLLSWRDATLVSLIQVMLYYVIAVTIFAHFARSEKDYVLALNGLICVGVFLAIVGITSRSMYYLGLHKNGVGDSLACITVVCAEMFFAAPSLKRKWLYGTAFAVVVGGLLFSFSRGGWLGAMTGLLVIFALRRQFKLIVQCAVLGVPVIAVLWHFAPEDQRNYAVGFGTERVNIKARYEMIDFARNEYLTSPLLGVGVGLRKEYDATNLFWLTLAETGPLGVIALASVHFAFLRMVWRTQRRLHRSSLQYSLLAIGGAMVMARMAHGMVDHYWARGGTSMAWASAGMAVHTYFATRRRDRLARLRGVARQREMQPGQIPVTRMLQAT
jgi:hypothetical protein